MTTQAKREEVRASLANMSTEEQFHAAVNVIKSLPKNGHYQPSDELKLKFYGYFKQATEGPNRTSKPPFYDIVARYKWDAWKKLDSMSKEEAMHSYIEELKKIVETMSYNEEISKFYEVLGPFYECALSDSPKKYPAKMNGDIPTNRDDLYPEERLINSSGYDYNEKCFSPSNGLGANGDVNDVESDGEEFSDTFDHIGNANSGASDLRNGIADDIISARGEVDVTGVRLHQGNLPNRPSSSRPGANRGMHSLGGTDNSALGSAGTAGDGSGSGGGQYNRDLNSEVNEQIAVAILRLQQSVEQLSNRVSSIEGRVNQAAHSTPSNGSTHWWPFSVCPKTMAFLITWPFVVHYVMTVLRERRRK